MDQQTNKVQKSGGSGFIFGVIVGVMIALLFTTKKGRAILRDITEKGIDKLSTLEELTKKVERGEYDDDFDEEDDYVKAQGSLSPAPKPVSQEKPVEVIVPKEEKKEAPSKPATKPVATKAPEPVKPDPEPVLDLKDEEEGEPEESHEKAPSKVIQGRRWFRGLKKKG